ncbi:hypothetical protein F444_20872 [Phytophthora nicotianae P1976]|uniref:Uncharacterized protein n=1 Tax=Phytophthora nicotianae P1976 TaxID=1317066 RepID=A0A080Z326_PHYNI|nr:hypothetical protein F444_20872 [Phytophthora nicotianae P1976]
MIPRSYSEDTALAEAAKIRQAVEGNGVQNEEAVHWCQNPFCRSVLYSSYTSYCERVMCQLHRGLKLQCQTNAEAAAQQELKSNGQSDSLLVCGTKSSASNEKEACEADEHFVIPRRKRRISVSATRNDATQSTELDPRHGSALDGTSAGSRSRKRPWLGQRMQFNEVLSYFEPQVPIIPALAVSSRMRAQRMQQASRWQTSRSRSQADGGHVQFNIRASLQSMGRPPIVTRPRYMLQCTVLPTTQTRAAASGRPARPKVVFSRRTEACDQSSQVVTSPPPPHASLVWPNPHSTVQEE